VSLVDSEPPLLFSAWGHFVSQTPAYRQAGPDSLSLFASKKVSKAMAEPGPAPPEKSLFRVSHGHGECYGLQSMFLDYYEWTDCQFGRHFDRLSIYNRLPLRRGDLTMNERGLTGGTLPGD